jgi:hypothetical protein
MGRMGNQMFQYACAKNLELKHGFICSLDDYTNLKYFELAPNEQAKNRFKEKLFFHIGKRFLGVESYNLDFDDMLQDFKPWLLAREKPTMIWGFFQSEEYFKESSEEIRQYFKIKQEYQSNFNQFLDKHQLQKGNYLAIHIRRTDYKGFKVKSLSGDDFTLPQGYYTEAIKQLSPHYPIVFVSDDPDYCRAEFSHLPNSFFSREDAITDFQILAHSKQLIISNSTFAWWAAWLNPHADLILSPRYFLGFKENKEVPVNIYPQHWNQITVKSSA